MTQKTYQQTFGIGGQDKDTWLGDPVKAFGLPWVGNGEAYAILRAESTAWRKHRYAMRCYRQRMEAEA